MAFLAIAILLGLLVLAYLIWTQPWYAPTASQQVKTVVDNHTVINLHISTAPTVDVSSIALLILAVAALIVAVAHFYHTFRK